MTQLNQKTGEDTAKENEDMEQDEKVFHDIGEQGEKREEQDQPDQDEQS